MKPRNEPVALNTVSDGLSSLPKDLRPAPQPADMFWTAFRERSRDLPRAMPEPWSPVRNIRSIYWAAAAVLLLSLTLWYAILPSRESAGTRIEVVTFSNEMDSFMIWEDAQGRGTIVWLLAQTPMESNGG